MGSDEKTSSKKKKKDEEAKKKSKKKKSSSDGDAKKKSEKKPSSKSKKSSTKNGAKDSSKDAKKSKKKSSSGKSKKSSSKSSSKDAKKEVKEGVCVICKDETVPATLIVVGSHCRHNFCLDCLEHRLARPIPGEPKPEDNHLGAPTLGRCPECNEELRKFGVKELKKSKLYYTKDFDIAESPLAGKVYHRKKTDSERPPIGSFHFDSDEKDDKGRMRPFMDFSEAIDHDEKEEVWVLNNGEPVPDRKFFDPGCHYDAYTRTFHGSISWKPCRFHGSHRWDIILGFAKDFSFLRVGLIHKRKERCGVVTMSSDKNRLLYPLDGRWKLTWNNADGEEQTGTVNVRNNEFRQGPYTFNLMLDDPSTPGFRWPLDPIYASSKSGLDLGEKPKGPGIGKKVVWETTHPSFPIMKWHRETIGEMPIQATEHLGPPPYEYIEQSNMEGGAAGKGGGEDSDSDEDSTGWDDTVSDSESESEESSFEGSSDDDSDDDDDDSD